jgi:hypothetical protein
VIVVRERGGHDPLDGHDIEAIAAETLRAVDHHGHVLGATAATPQVDSGHEHLAKVRAAGRVSAARGVYRSARVRAPG